MKNNIGKKVLATSTSWFLAPDGRQYKGVFGTLKAIHTSQDTLGFVPSRTHTNWYLEIGDTFLAGCQILHMIQTEVCETEDVTDFTTDKTLGDGVKEIKLAEIYKRPSYIYFADGAI